MTDGIGVLLCITLILGAYNCAIYEHSSPPPTPWYNSKMGSKRKRYIPTFRAIIFRAAFTLWYAFVHAQGTRWETTSKFWTYNYTESTCAIYTAALGSERVTILVFNAIVLTSYGKNKYKASYDTQRLHIEGALKKHQNMNFLHLFVALFQEAHFPKLIKQKSFQSEMKALFT